MKPVLGILLSLCLASAVSAETWHVDSERGDDARSGLSPTDAWRTLAKLQQADLKPGDTILLMSGSVWREPLVIARSGSATAPITVARGGKGAWPRIDAGGVAENAVEIRNADNIVLSGIEITNKGEGAVLRRGVFVNEVDFGVASNIVLRDLYIHDVTGTNARKDNGGIIFSALGPKVPTRFEGITIERNIVWRVDRSGIAGISDQVTVARWFPSRFVVIRDNVLEDIGGDGIVPRGTDGALIEHNIVRHAAMRAGDYSAGVWQWSTDNSLIQLNEAAFTHGILDGQGFDSDYNSRRTTLVYNFSHDNEGGFLLLCTPVKRDAADNIGNDGTVVRLNVSYNDRERIFQIAGGSKALIERNVIHAPEGEVQMVAATWWDGWSQGIEFRDNWLGTRGTARYGYETGRSNGHYILGDGFPPPLDLRFSGNVYAGGHASIPEDGEPKLREERVAREKAWEVPVFDPSMPDELPDFLARHRYWMMDMLQREIGHRPVLEQPKLMYPENWRRR